MRFHVHTNYLPDQLVEWLPMGTAVCESDSVCAIQTVCNEWHKEEICSIWVLRYVAAVGHCLQAGTLVVAVIQLAEQGSAVHTAPKSCLSKMSGCMLIRNIHHIGCDN